MIRIQFIHTDGYVVKTDQGRSWGKMGKERPVTGM